MKENITNSKDIFDSIKETVKSIISTSSIEKIVEIIYEFFKKSFDEFLIKINIYETKEEIIYVTPNIEKEILYNKSIENNIYTEPLIYKEKLLGDFTLKIFQKENFTQLELDLIKEIIPFLAIGIKNSIETNQLKKLTQIDDLTGIYNRRFFYKVFNEKFKDSVTKGEKSFLYLIDINNFKKVNDNFGHSIGDKALIKIASTLKEIFKQGCVGRYGGDEFLCGIVGITPKEAVELAEKTIGDIYNLRIKCKPAGKGTSASIGIIELDSHKELRDHFVELDKNLYSAKKNTNKIAFTQKKT